MLDDPISRIEAAFEAGPTPGPWVLEDKERSNLVSNGEVWVEAVVARNYQEINDAALIVAAVNALPSLLGEVERLRCRNEVLWNALWKASGDHEPHVAANLESVGGNPADFLDDDMNGEHDDRQ